MTTKQVDKVIGREISVRFPAYQQEGNLTIVRRRVRSRIVETADGGVYDCADFELIRINN